MENQNLEIGKTYDVKHNRKGNFKMRLDSLTETWATGTIIEGKTITINPDNSREEGEEVTIRIEFASFELSK